MTGAGALPDASATNRYGDTANTQRSSSFDAQTGASSYDASRSATGASGSSVTRQSEAEAGAQGSGVGHDTSVCNARTGQTNTHGSGSSEATARWAGSGA